MTTNLKNVKLKQIIILFVLVRILSSFVLINYYEKDMYLSGGGGDATEYKYVANSIVSGNGYISYENNKSRELGDNYIYAGVPFYPTYLAFFYWFGLTDIWVGLLSSFFLYLILILSIWKISEALDFSSKIKILLSLGIMLCSSLNLYSFKMLSEMAGITFLTLVFWQTVRWWKSPKLSAILIISIFTGLGILTRISFIILPFCIALMIFLKLNKHGFKQISTHFIVLFILLLPWMVHNKITLDIFTPYASFHSPVYNPESYNELLTIYRITDNEFWTNEVRFMSEPEKKELYLRTDHGFWGYSKLYLLRMRELFRLFPSGEPFNRLYMQMISSLFQIPFLIGLLLLVFSKSYFGKGFKVPWILFIIGFIYIHVDRNLPHTRYMLPLLPIGYISFFAFIDQKIKESFKLIKH